MHPSHPSYLPPFDELQREREQGRTRHCGNFDPSHPGCIECPGLVQVKHVDGRVDTICRAGESAMRRLLMDLPPS